jgi:hypothetical protein
MCAECGLLLGFLIHHMERKRKKEVIEEVG